MQLRRLFSALILCVAACGDDDGGGGTPDAGGSPDAAPPELLDPPPDGEGLQLRMQARIEAGQEITYCQYFVLPAGAGVDVSRFEHRYTAGSHHLLLFPTTLTAAEVAMDQAMFDCASRGDLKNLGVAYGAQEPDGDMTYPQGVAMHFDSEEVVLLQSHYLNTNDQAVDADVRVNLWYATGAITAYAGTLFYYDWAILVPPAPGTATVKMRCTVPTDITVLYASSHMHRRGVGFRSWLTGGDLAQPLALHMTDDWESPDPTTWTPPLTIQGGQAIEYECDFKNDLPTTVIEGPSAETNEMCMFVAGYYPKLSEAAEFCLEPGSGPQRNGTKTCAETLSCFGGTQDPIAQEQCLMDTCAASSQPFNDFVLCIIRNDCQDNGCIAQKCGTEYTACQSAACN